MSTLIVTAHPDPSSLTHRTARRLQELLGEGVTGLAHLAQEGFDPRFTLDDRQVHLGQGQADPAVVAEQRRVGAATDLVLVFPVFWWSMPALLKGWIDRVFVAGWAFGYNDGQVVPMLQRLTVHLLPISGTSAEAFARHGYARSFSTQVEHGVVDFCGARRGTTTFIYDSELVEDETLAGVVEAAAAEVAGAVRLSAKARRAEGGDPLV